VFFLFSAMSDHDTKLPDGASSLPKNYPNPSVTATHSLREKLLLAIASKGMLSFPEYLDLVLYDPTLGYYARQGQQVGRGGDFFTSVSVGPLFGRLLAQRFLKWWEENGRPERWRILETGAHDGMLAADVLTEIRVLSPAAWDALEYAIPEPLPRLRNAQRDRLESLASSLFLAESFEAIAAKPLPGIAFGNEILDALPFHLIKRISGEWQELSVSADSDGKLELVPSTSPSAADNLDGNFPENYQTEVRTNFPSFLKAMSSCIDGGLLLFFDYGFAAPEYYDIHRSSGTLRTYSKHKAAEDPLERPGEIDITAHVNFTDLALAAGALGYNPVEFSTQGSYLTHLAKPLIASGGLDDPKLIAQFQSLTHPAHLGAKFHAIEFEKGAKTSPTTAHRLALEI
jgi:SAM-dependent MidA family methyltransferase